MQDHFLFDDDDPKQRGAGCDKLGTKKDGLALYWTWGNYGKKEKPGQCCYAEVGEGWRLEVVFWHSNYEASVRYYDATVSSWDKDVGDDYQGEVLVTRLQAQLKAEQLVLDIWKELGELLDTKGIIVNQVIARLQGKRKIT